MRKLDSFLPPKIVDVGNFKGKMGRCILLQVSSVNNSSFAGQRLLKELQDAPENCKINCCEIAFKSLYTFK